MIEITLGEWIAALYEACLDEYGDPELAAVAAAALVNDHLVQATAPESTQAAAA